MFFERKFVLRLSQSSGIALESLRRWKTDFSEWSLAHKGLNTHYKNDKLTFPTPLSCSNLVLYDTIIIDRIHQIPKPMKNRILREFFARKKCNYSRNHTL